MSVAVQRPPTLVGNSRNSLNDTLDKILKGKVKYNVEDDPLVVWDNGVFLSELQRQGIVLSTDHNGSIDGDIAANTGLKKGSYKGTQLALTQIYNLIEQSAVCHFDAKGYERIMPTKRDLQEKQATYKWSDGSDGYPPHLDTLPDDEKAHGNTLFDTKLIEVVQAVAKMFSFMIPDSLSHIDAPYVGPTIADCEEYNRRAFNLLNPEQTTDIMKGENIGNKEDWYSDARFAQQHLSGVNPSTIETAPAQKVAEYVEEANKQGLNGMKQLLRDGKDLLIQDYSYFRKATGVSDEDIFQSIVPELNEKREPTGKFVRRFACASVVLFQLHSDGRLHPLAITLDYKGSLDKSITLFNQRLTPNDKGDIDEKDDWPWRYAKTCVQTADWTRHEIAVHLVDTHLVEEAIIVATNRTIPDDHLLYEILSPHWYKTLALNAAARAVLVPAVIARLSGLGPTINASHRAYKLVDWSYKNFNFQEKYIPTDLKKRGFNLEAPNLGDKYRNYPYATNMYILWAVIRDFVKSVLETKYKCDQDIQDDPYIAPWCTEIQTKGKLTTFPTIKTVDQLIDAVTMCIHTASPQHTAVNYLQDYYYSFVPSKPPALCTPLPSSLSKLKTYTEADLTSALPIGVEDPKWKDWLLAAQLPELLSFKVQSDYNLITYAKSLYNVNKSRTNFERKEFNSEAIKNAAARFYSQLKNCEVAFKDISDNQTEGTIEYKVLQPELTAISILI